LYGTDLIVKVPINIALMQIKSFDALLTHPYSTPAKIPCLEPSAWQTNTVKYHFLGD
jgi:hypothetical protein